MKLQLPTILRRFGRHSSGIGLTWIGLLMLVAALVGSPGCSSVPDNDILGSTIVDSGGDEQPADGGADDGAVDDGGANDSPDADDEVLDSDGDGFSDDYEINSIPGTDPYDATDNPNNVRDTDDDGCSDFDELNFDGFCNNDPYTPMGGSCDVAYYNSDFGYGFDLPVGADLQSFDDQQAFLFNATWSLDLGPDVVHVVTRVQGGRESESVLELAGALNAGARPDGSELLVEMPVTLPNGDPGYLSVFVVLDPEFPIVYYEAIAVKHGRAYFVNALGALDDLTPATDAVLTEVVLSLCVD